MRISVLPALLCLGLVAGAPPASSRTLLQASSDIVPPQSIVITGPPSYTTTHPTTDSTLLQLKNPSCFGKAAALLGSFCVPPTTAEQDADPENKLPRITFTVERKPGTSPMTLFLFDDEKNSWPSFWEMSMRNRSCEEMAAKVVVPEKQDGVIDSYMNIMGKFPHNWYVVVVDCQSSTCPEVLGANLTFFHPNSDGSADACSGLPLPALALKEALVEGWHALSVDKILDVAGLSPFGVAVLYAAFAGMLLVSLLFLLWGARADTSRRFFFWNTLFVTSISCMCYLAMATGNGILVLRRTESGGGAWRLSEDLVSNPGSKEHPNPLYDAAYASAKTYPVFLARHVLQLATGPLLLLSLFLVSGVSGSTRAFMLFCGTMMSLCWFAGAVITAPSRWGFWVFGLVFSAGVLIPMVGVLPTAAARRGRPVRRLYGRLMCLQLVTGALYPWAWVLIDGAHALPSDLAVIVYVALDTLSQAVFGIMLLTHAPTPAGWSDDSGGDAQSLERLNRTEEVALGAGPPAGVKSRYNGAVMGGGVGLGNTDEY